jgi:hypothetical protein
MVAGDRQLDAAPAVFALHKAHAWSSLQVTDAKRFWRFNRTHIKILVFNHIILAAAVCGRAAVPGDQAGCRAREATAARARGSGGDRARPRGGAPLLRRDEAAAGPPARPGRRVRGRHLYKDPAERREQASTGLRWARNAVEARWWACGSLKEERWFALAACIRSNAEVDSEIGGSNPAQTGQSGGCRAAGFGRAANRGLRAAGAGPQAERRGRAAGPERSGLPPSTWNRY